jgi:hypothetical protein
VQQGRGDVLLAQDLVKALRAPFAVQSLCWHNNKPQLLDMVTGQLKYRGTKGNKGKRAIHSLPRMAHKYKALRPKPGRLFANTIEIKGMVTP